MHPALASERAQRRSRSRSGRDSVAQDASRCYDACIAHAVEIGDRATQAALSINVGVNSLGDRRFEEVRVLFERGRILARESGNAMWECNAESGLGDLARAEGDLADARRHYEASLALARRIGALTWLEIRETVNLAWVALEEGSLVEAMRIPERMDGELGVRGDESPYPRRLGLAAETAHRGGEIEHALDVYMRVHELLQSLPSLWWTANILVPLGSLLLELNRRDEARQRFLEAEVIAREGSNRLFGDLPAAWLALMGDRDVASVDAAGIADVPHRAEAHLVLHRAGAGGAHLAEARTIMERMSRHLSGPALEQFWKNNPTARGVLAEEARGQGIGRDVPRA